MPKLTFIVGVVLILVGLGGYVAAGLGESEYRSWTALIPAIPGVVFVVCGFMAARSERARKHWMHLAVLIALLGTIAPLGRLPTALSADPINRLTVFSMVSLLVLCLVVLIAGIRSFIVARRARQADPTTTV